MRLANPQMLLWLLVVPALIVGQALCYGWRRRALLALGDAPRIAELTRMVSPGWRLTKAVAFVAAVTLLIVALARPQAGERTTLARTVGLDLVVALDFSNSMLARDAYPSRIERAKAELGRLLDGLGGDRVGLVAFAGETLSYPLTTDYAAAKLFWRDMSPLDMPVGGTAIGKAISAATRLLVALRGKGEDRAQVIILLTDGEDHQSDPLAAAKEAARLGIRIFTVGIGSRSGEPIPQLREDGSIAGYLRDADGRPVTTRLDDGVLRQIAQTGAGRYLEMDPRTFSVEPIRAELATLKRAEAEERLIQHYDEVYAWFLAPALLLLLFEALISGRRRKRATVPAIRRPQLSGGS